MISIKKEEWRSDQIASIGLVDNTIHILKVGGHNIDDVMVYEFPQFLFKPGRLVVEMWKRDIDKS